MSQETIDNEMSDDSLEQTETVQKGDQLSLFVNLDGFEGPIDLLLSLSREQKVDLTRISILPLAEQYLEFINKSAGTPKAEVTCSTLGRRSCSRSPRACGRVPG